MKGSVITDIEQLTPAWLTALFRRNGVLNEGAVSTVVHTHSRNSNVSTIYYLTINYTSEEGNAPRKLLVKIPAAEFHKDGWGHKELRFYTEIVPSMRERYDWSELPVIRTLDAAYSKKLNRSHYLFENVSDKFRNADGPIPPAPEFGRKVIEGFALIHAFWWENRRLITEFGEAYTPERIGAFLQMARARYEKFSVSVGKKVSDQQLEILRSVVSRWPSRRIERLVNGKGITLVHRDPHPLNILYSIDHKAPTVKLIDWQSWRADTGTDDLAYYIACHWPTPVRDIFEVDLIRHYQKTLLHLGVQDYSWSDCWYDYRASIIRCLFFLIAAWSPVQWERGWWWDKVQHGLNAFQDHGCAELLLGQ